MRYAIELIMQRVFCFCHRRLYGAQVEVLFSSMFGRSLIAADELGFCLRRIAPLECASISECLFCVHKNTNHPLCEFLHKGARSVRRDFLLINSDG